MASPMSIFYDTTGLLKPASITKFNTAATEMLAMSPQIMHIANLCDHASQRLGPQAPFLKTWETISISQSQRATLFDRTCAHWKSLEADLDVSNEAKVNEWKSAFDVAAETFSVWVGRQREVMERGDVRRYVAEEEAAVAAERK
ncbi:hypothetical protein P7C71_g2082, partial [Lecanoromycetidae sp. Uapishka_2]